MMHYAGINCTTSNDKGQNNILGQAINHSATIKIKKKKARKMVKSFLERAYFSYVLISEQGKNLANTDFPVLSAIWDGGGYYVGGWCLWKKCRYAHQQAGLIFQSRWSLPISTDFSRDGGEISEYPTNRWTFLCPWTWTEGAHQHCSRASGVCLERTALSTWPPQPLAWIRAVLCGCSARFT